MVGVVSGDVVAINAQTGSFDDKNIGTGKPVTAALTINGADAANYSLTQPTGLSADITTKELTVSNAIASDKIYDGNTNAEITGLALIGIVSGDVVAINAQTGSFDDKNIGTGKPVTSALTINGADAANYSLTQPTGLTADITPKGLTISGIFSVMNKVYDGGTIAIIDENNLLLQGVINPDAVELMNVVAEFAQADISENTLVSITGAELDGADKFNYTLSLANSPVTTANITTFINDQTVILNNLKVYPNPFTDRIYFAGITDNAEVTLTNLAGQRLMIRTMDDEESISLSYLPSGVYFLNIKLTDIGNQTFKIIKQ